MKPKHNGLAILIIFAVTGIGMLSYSILLSNQAIGSVRVTRPTTAKDIKVPDAPTMAYINFLLPKLDSIATTGNHVQPVSLDLFGYTPPLPGTQTEGQEESISGTNSGKPKPSGEIENLSYVLTLSFTAKNKKFCMIDGKLFAENGALPDGGKILKIETGRVYIQKNQIKKWIYSQNQ